MRKNELILILFCVGVLWRDFCRLPQTNHLSCSLINEIVIYSCHQIKCPKMCKPIQTGTVSLVQYSLTPKPNPNLPILRFEFGEAATKTWWFQDLRVLNPLFSKSIFFIEYSCYYLLVGGWTTHLKENGFNWIIFPIFEVCKSPHLLKRRYADRSSFFDLEKTWRKKI